MKRERGMALVAVLLAITLLLTLGSALAVLATTETAIAARARDGTTMLYAADAIMERVVSDLAASADWNAVLNGTVRSPFVDGAPSGLRSLPDGSVFNLTEATELERCGKRQCSEDDVRQMSRERPWGANNPRWQLFAHGPLAEAVGRQDPGSAYVVAWVGDDPADIDGDPLRDSPPGEPGAGTVVVLAQAYGRGSTRRTIEATLQRAGTGVRMLTWRERH